MEEEPLRLYDLHHAVRSSGLPVVEVDGWRGRGHGDLARLDGIVMHHTATPLAARGSYPSLRIVRDGRAGLPGPLAQLGLGRDGTVYVIASGVAYHAGRTRYTRQDNWHTIGIEAEHDGVSPWPPETRHAYVRLVTALAKWYRLPIPHIEGHKEVCDPPGRKIDPNFDMDDFRTRVRTRLRNQEKDWFAMATKQDLIAAIHEALDTYTVDVHSGDGDKKWTLSRVLRNLERQQDRDRQILNDLNDALKRK